MTAICQEYTDRVCVCCGCGMQRVCTAERYSPIHRPAPNNICVALHKDNIIYWEKGINTWAKWSARHFVFFLPFNAFIITTNEHKYYWKIWLDYDEEIFVHSGKIPLENCVFSVRCSLSENWVFAFDVVCWCKASNKSLIKIVCVIVLHTIEKHRINWLVNLQISQQMWSDVKQAKPKWNFVKYMCVHCAVAAAAAVNWRFKWK